MKKHIEARLEEAIVDYLTNDGGYVFVDYREGHAKDRYNRSLALDPFLVIEFIKSTQERTWKSLVSIHHDETAKIVLEHLVKELDTKGMLKVLRQGSSVMAKNCESLFLHQTTN